MLETQRNSSTHRYAKGKLLPLSMNKGRSYSTFYSKGKERSERVELEEKRQDRLKSLKEFIDVYFEEQGRSNSHRMPMIRRRSQLFNNDRIQRKTRNKAQEQLSKSVAIDNTIPNNDSFLPMTTTLRWSVSALQQQLPSIHQQTQGVQQQKQQFALLSQTYQLSFLRRTSSLYSSQVNPQWQSENKNLTFQNQIFCIYLLFKEGKAVGRVKEFKEAGLPFMDRENRMKNYGISSLWKESKYNHRSFAISLRPPIKDQLLRIMPDEANPQQLKIKQKPLHIRLTANNCQEMCLLLRQICLQLKKVEGRVLNNKINPSNLFLKGSGLQLAEWAYSSFREEFTIRQGRFQKRRYGVLRGNEWFVSPEYLAPEIIAQFLGEETQVWGAKSSPDIWSLGLSFFEMITLIPIWITAKCSLTHRPSIVRNGVLAAPGRELTLLHKKQATIQKTIKKLLYSQTIQSQQNDKLFAVIVRMLQPDISKRISLDQILESL